MRFPFGEFVTVRRQTVDQYGDPVTASEHRVGRCSFLIRRSLETTTNFREETNSIATLLGPHDADIGPQDIIVRDNGEEWQVFGEVGRTVSPFSGWKPGFRVELRRVEG